MFSSMKTLTRLLLVSVACAALVFTVRVPNVFAGDIVARGSDSTIKAVEALAAAYKQKTGTTIKVEGGGSSKGAKGGLAGAVDLAFMSRAPKSKEVAAGLVGVPYAIDGVAVIVNKNNPTDDLTMDELKAIYTGLMKKWASGKPILALNRPATSGTREVFQNKVIGKGTEFDPRLKTKHHKASLMTVSKAITSIAYTSAGALTGEEAVKVVTINGVTPEAATLRDGTYPISRTPHFGTKGKPTGELKAFLDFVLSDEGQKVVKSVGFVPMREV